MALLRRYRWLALSLGVALLAGIWVAMRGAGVARNSPSRAPAAAETRATVEAPVSPPIPIPPDDRTLESKQEPAPAERSSGADDDALTLEEMRTQTRLFGAAHVRARYEGRDLLGVQIFDVAPGSFWDLLGLHDGDLIIESDGQLIDTPEASVALINALSREPVLVLRVRDRAGDERTFEYRTPR